MEPERRHQSRKEPDKLTYVHFVPENGGIVLNASEGGIAFFAIAPLHQTGPIRLAIVPRNQERIFASGRVVWTDETKKVGGLGFAELDPDVREQIRGWLSQSAAPPYPEENTMPLHLDVLHARAKLGPHVSVARGTPSPDVKIPAAPASSVHTFPATSFLPESVPSDRQIHPSQPQFMRGAATGIIISIFALMTFVYVQNFHPEITNSLIRFGKNLVGTTQPLSASPDAAPAQPASPVHDDRPATSKSNAETSAKEAVENSALPPKVEPLPKSSPPAISRATERTNTPQPVHHASGTGNNTATLEQLWNAVAQGDTAAEVELAQRYLAGNSVPKNCEQARVLLSAASKKGNVEATRQYQRLLTTGCN
jgi:hypothetical protein